MSMASSLLYKNLLKQLEDQLRCHICSEFYDKCVMAACSHNFCSACIKKRLATESDCPNCFEEIEENDLRRNKMLDTLVRFYKKIQSQVYSYCVIRFLEEFSSMCVVPTVWIDKEEADSFCWWPSKDIKKHVILKSIPAESWTRYKVEVIHSTRNHTSAQNYLKHFVKENEVEFHSVDSKTHVKKLKLDGISSAFSPLVIPDDTSNQPQILGCGSCSAVLSVVQEISEKIDSVIKKQTATETGLSEIQQCLSVMSIKMDIPSKEKYEMEGLPLKDSSQLTNLESLLDNSEEFTKCVKHLGQFGGRDLNDITRRILFSLIENPFACQMNWVGSNGKVGLKFYPRVLQLVAAAVRETPETKDSKYKDVEDIVKKWLRTAQDRFGGQRAKRKHANR